MMTVPVAGQFKMVAAQEPSVTLLHDTKMARASATPESSLIIARQCRRLVPLLLRRKYQLGLL